MFVQVIQGRTSQPQALRARFDLWMEELLPDASGWQGSTSGATDEGQFISIVRFESQEAARRNSDRPQQGQWWAETEKLLEGEASFHDSTDVETWFGGAASNARFVQVIQARVTDIDRVRALQADALQAITQHRPEILGAVIAWYDGHRFTQAVYFTNEPAARQGEAKTPPKGLQRLIEERRQLLEEVRFLDLRDPWHHEW